MIVILSPRATDADLDELVNSLKERGYGVHVSKGVEKTIVGAICALEDEKIVVGEQLS